MHKMKYVFLLSASLFLSAVIFFFSNCRTASLPPESESACIGTANDGSIIVKAWGYGQTQRGAIENAKKNAVQDVLFKGIKSGQSGCPTRPIVEDISKRDNAYFKNFFKAEGAYLQFVNLSTDAVPDRVKVGSRIKAGMYVIVDHRRLKKQMESDNQVRNLNSGF